MAHDLVEPGDTFGQGRALRRDAAAGQPGRGPLWSTVAVEAASAALADAVSTAAVFLDEDALRDLPARLPGLRRILAVPGRGPGRGPVLRIRA